ncbi:MAG: pesticidal protein Cry7Aa [bacterium]
MIKLKREGVIIEPTHNEFEKKAVLNPGVLQVGKDLHIVYRAIAENGISCLGYARLNGPTKIAERWDKPFMVPKTKIESHGIEDPRLMMVDGQVVMTYVAHDGKHAVICYSIGNDLFNLKRGGIISPQIPYSKAGKLFRYSSLKDEYYFFESFYNNYGGKGVWLWEKDGVFFPERINGKLALVHRILPDMHVIYADNFKQLRDKLYWQDYLMNLRKYVMLEPEYNFEIRHLGAGAPPIKTRYGWLMIYHGTDESNDGRTYHGGAALFDKKDPTRCIARLPYPILSPDKDYELRGLVSEVVFPTGTAIFDDKMYIYYGAADKYIATASIKLESLLTELLKYKIKKRKLK